MRVKASIEVPGGISWSLDADTASRQPGICIVGKEWPKPLYVDGRHVGVVGAISRMDSEDMYGDSMVPITTIPVSTTLDCILYL